MNIFSCLALLLILAAPVCAANQTLGETISSYDQNKTIFTANVATITGIMSSLKDALTNAKKQYDGIIYDKNTAVANVKKYTNAVEILQQQLTEAQNNLKTASATVTLCESKIGSVNATLGQAVDGQSTSLATSMTAILSASDGMSKLAANSITAEAQKLESANAKKQAQTIQATLETLKKEIGSIRMQYAAAAPQAPAAK
jgi:chromosome segregation ATPase